MSDLIVLSACWDPISKAAHKYVRPRCVISLLRPDIEGSSQICQTSHSVISLLRPDIEGSSQICQTSQCYQPVETRYRRQLTNMSDLTVLPVCWDPISKTAHKYVRPHSVISLLRPDIEGSSQICQTSQCYQPVETRYWRQLKDMSDLTVLSACWDPISKTAHKYVKPLTMLSACTRYRRQLTNMSYLTVLSTCWDPISKAAHKYVRSHNVISLLRPDIEGNSQICHTSQCYQPVETRYRRQLTNMSDFIVVSACWDTISHWCQCT